MVCVEAEEVALINLDNAPVAFVLVLAAGLSTAVGASAVYCTRVVKLVNTQVLAAGLGFSGGVMLYVSFVEIFTKSLGAFEADGYAPKDAYYLATLCLFAGMLLLRLLGLLVHKIDAHHSHDCCDINQRQGVEGQETAAGQDVDQPAATDAAPTEPQPTATGHEKDRKLERMGLNTAVAIAIHNFPEGLATFVATLADAKVGFTLAVAIAIHNVPEGLCVALPVFYASGSVHKGFFWALLSGLSEPVGAFIGWLIIKSTGDDMNQKIYGILFGVVGGMMIMIVLLELLPTAYRYDPNDTVVTNGLVCGMLVMAASLCLFTI